MSHKHPNFTPNDSVADNRPPIAITRTRSAQRMWSDPIPRTQKNELAYLHPFAAPGTLYHNNHNNIASNRTMITTSAAPIADAVYRGEIPLRSLPSTFMSHYRHGSNNYSRYNSNIINNIHDLNLYEDDHHGYDVCAVQPVPRVMKQAPKLLTLDDYNLISLGYKPVMSRKLPWINLMGITITAANVFSGIIPLYGFTVTNGGPAWATWSYLFIGLMSIIVTLCLAELATAYPTTAGVHHWVYQLGSARRRAFMSWMVGWFTIVSTVTITASLAFFFSAMLSQLLLSLHKISLTPATLVMFHLGALFAWQLFNLIPIRALGYISTFSAIFIVGLAVALISAMLSMADFGPSTSHIPFTAFMNYSGSPSAAYAAISSALMGSFVFCPQDTVIRMAEESRRPERIVGRLMIGSSISTLLAGLPLIIVLNYGVIKPIKGLLDDTVPGVRVIMETLGNISGTVFVSLVLVAMFSTGVIRLAVASRTVYSFARDGGLPHSSYWNHLHPSKKTPQRVSWLVTAACMSCIFPFFWGNSVAFQWISSLGCISANICFVIPLWMRLTHEGGLHFIPGSFTLGRYSRPLHIISIIWLLLLSFFLMLPPSHPITKNNFNYAPVVIIILIIIFGVSWFKARTDFTGGAKDVSRASHRAPSSTFKDIFPMSPHNQTRLQIRHEGSQESEPRSMGFSYRKQPAHTTIQKSNTYSTSDKSRHFYNFRTKYSPTSRFDMTKQQRQQQHRQQVSLAPPKRDPFVNKKQQFQSDVSAITTSSSSNTSQLGQRTPVTNPTMISVTSIQSHPSSILGIPFSESPEMMPNELVVRNSSLPSPPATTATANTSKRVEAHTLDGLAEFNLLLTKPYGATEMTQGSSPEMSIDSPITKNSERAGYSPDNATMTTKGSRSFKVSNNYSAGPTTSRNYVNELADKSKTKPSLMPPLAIKIHHSDSGNNDDESSSNPSDLLIVQPMSAKEGFFKSGLGLSNKLADKKAILTHENASNIELNSSRKNRSPTPYPSNIADVDEFGVSSDHNGSAMMDDPYLFPGGSTLSARHNICNYKGGKQASRSSEYSIEEIISAMDISSLSSSINHHQANHIVSQFPTLDGYPLLKSPSVLTRSEGYESLDLSRMLPLSRTRTIQQSDNEFGAPFEVSDSEEGDGEIKSDMLSEPDNSSDEPHSQNYSIIPITKSRPHALTPVASTPRLFQLPNRDISTISCSNAPVAPSTSVENSSSENTTARSLPFPLPRLQPPTPTEGRHDPIERLLLMAQKQIQEQEGPPQKQQQLQQQLQQQMQRTRNVAQWAKEQAVIQGKREKHNARMQSLKELRKYDPAATLSADSSDTSFSTTFSEKSENSPSSASWSLTQSQNQSCSSSGGAGVGVGGSISRRSERFRKQSKMNGINNFKLQSLKEGETLKMSRLELLVRAQEEEEEPGMYADTDDVLSPTVDVESIGAGVGKPSFAT
ncbi:hypothetical protein BGZ49_000416 [Haplosporangium sp. Z 27]|nr:hypothetical protein BGZ49_000416 [Haplosporangium sp. Z 27]